MNNYSLLTFLYFFVIVFTVIVLTQTILDAISEQTKLNEIQTHNTKEESK